MPLPVKDTGRAHTELKKTVCARTVPQRDLWERKQTEMPLLVKGTRRAHTELKKQYVPVQYPRGIYGSGSRQKCLCWLRVQGGHIRN